MEVRGHCYAPARFTLREEAPGTHWLGGWEGLGVGLHALEGIQVSYPCRESNLNYLAVQPLSVAPFSPYFSSFHLYILPCLFLCLISSALLFCFLSLLLSLFYFRSECPANISISQTCEATCSWSISTARDIVAPSVCHLSLHLILRQPDLQHVILIKGQLGVKWVDFSGSAYPVMNIGHVQYESAFFKRTK
jgi:hypothetical protein